MMLINNHLQEKNRYASMLEFIVTLALCKVQSELPTEFPKGIIEPEKRAHGVIYDIYIENSSFDKIAIELKNASGYISLGYKDIEKKLNIHKEFNLSSLIIAPFLSRILQGELIERNGFFCSLGYNITQDVDDETLNAFYKEKFGNTFIFYELEDWETAAEGKTWLRLMLNEIKFNEILKTADRIFKDLRLAFILRKIRGIFKYLNLVLYKNSFFRICKTFSTLGDVRITKAKVEQISLLDELFFCFLISKGKRFTANSLIDVIKDKSEYLMKLNTSERMNFIEGMLKLLRKFKYIKQDGRSYFSDDIETPYPSKMQIDLSYPQSQKSNNPQ